MHNLQMPFKIWMPRTHLEEVKSALAVDLRQSGIHLLEHDLQHIHRYNLPILPDYFSVKWWLFTSRLAVRTWASTLQDAQMRLPETIQIACVGASTAEAVTTYLDRTADFIPPNASDAKRFAEAFHQSLSHSTTALWICSALAEDTFQEQLQSKGHEVRRVSLYHPEPLEANELKSKLQEAEAFQPDFVVLTSPSNVKVLEATGAFFRLKPRGWVALGRKTLHSLEELPLEASRVHGLTHPTASAILELCSREGQSSKSCIKERK